MQTTAVSSFPATRWTAVMNLRTGATPEDQQNALDSLCRDYWYPLYAFARKSGKPPADAEDLTQGFFCYLLERDLFQAANPDLGKMRTFLLTAFQRYMGGVRTKDSAGKRGGGQVLFSLDVSAAEQHFGEPADTLTPGQTYDRQWAISLLDAALGDLRAGEVAAGREPVFVALEPFLNPASTSADNYDAACTALGVNTEAARKAVSRLRAKFREVLRQRIAGTLRFPAESLIDEELSALKAALRIGRN